MQNNGRALGSVATTALIIAAGLATRKSAARTWSKVSDQPAPPEQDNAEIRMRDALAWAVLSGAAVGLARVFVRRLVAYRGTPMGGRRSS